MIKVIIFSLILGGFTSLSMAQLQGGGGFPHSNNVMLSSSPIVSFTKPDIKALRTEDAKNDIKGNGPWRFGAPHDVDFNLTNSGLWFDGANGAKIWIFTVECEQALSINFLLKDIQLPEGNELFIYNEDKSVVLGKFTANHLYKGQLGTELIQGSKATIEYYVAPGNSTEFASLTIERIVHGYRTTEEFSAKAFGSAGACNMNVNCPDGAPWSKQKRSAIMLVAGSGTGFCSGALINNTLNDGKPYVLTANHCYGNPTSWVFRFNWEAASCANPGTSPSFSSLSGGVLRSRRTASDFCLIEITGGLESGAVPASFNPYYAGWDNSGAMPTSAVCIHHPKGDIKKISFEDEHIYSVQSTVSGVQSDVNGSWEIQWDRGTTAESASSGSPLFDQNGRIIGQLWGGQAGCNNLTGNDYFGRLHTSWEPAGSNSTNQLKHWLDPTNINAVVIDGFDPALGLVSLDATIIAPQGVNETYCVNTIEPGLTLVNLGTAPITTAIINYGVDGTEDQIYNWSGSLAHYQSIDISLPTMTVSAGAHQFSATVSAPNGGSDQVVTNNALSSSFYNVIGGENITLKFNLDCYGTETSWKLIDQDGNVLYKSEGYINEAAGLYEYSFCVTEDCYSFEVYDSYGDGMTGCLSGSGSYQILNENNVVVAQMLQSEAFFGTSFIRPICLGSIGVSELSTVSFNLYPNPSNDYVTISSDKSLIEKIECYSVTGQFVLAEAVNDFSKVLDVSSLSPGIYLVKVYSNGAASTARLVVE